MSGRPAGWDADEAAFALDLYLESLLARRPVEPDGVPADLQATAGVLAALPRFHPSFRFEERVAARLADLAAGRSPAVPDADAPRLIDFPGPPVPGSAGRPGQVRPVVLGSVLTSAALSIAGAAYVAWRRSHPPADPMLRAVRAVARGRIA